MKTAIALRRTAVVILGSLLSFGVSAHHSSAPYFDHSRVIEAEGEITEVLWQNPHIRFTLRDDQGRDWDIETIIRRASPDRISVCGRPGDAITVSTALHGTVSSRAVAAIFPPRGKEKA